jgi:uncharacterized LabA/DUF88 family protein
MMMPMNINTGWVARTGQSPPGCDPEVFFFLAMNRTAFLIDGFNLYHSVKSASQDLGLQGAGTKWLDINSLCRSYLHAIGNNAQVTSVFYFSALARHIETFKPDVVKRHLLYTESLHATGVSVVLSRFKKKQIPCDHCGQKIKRYEEKETDVALAVKLMEILIADQCDTAMLMTGDTDIVPAVRTAQSLFPQKTIGFLLPYKRHNQELAKLASLHIEIKKEAYTRHQFPDPFITPTGKSLSKPATW